MKESDYLLATNLTKARIALDCLRSILAINSQDRGDLAKAINATVKIVNKLEAQVETRGDGGR